MTSQIETKLFDFILLSETTAPSPSPRAVPNGNSSSIFYQLHQYHAPKQFLPRNFKRSTIPPNGNSQPVNGRQHFRSTSTSTSRANCQVAVQYVAGRPVFRILSFDIWLEDYLWALEKFFFMKTMPARDHTNIKCKRVMGHFTINTMAISRSKVVPKLVKTM